MFPINPDRRDNFDPNWEEMMDYWEEKMLEFQRVFIEKSDNLDATQLAIFNINLHMTQLQRTVLSLQEKFFELETNFESGRDCVI